MNSAIKKSIKHVSLLIIVCGILMSCENKKTDALVGKWILTEQLIDIGDGKGTFKKTEAGDTLEFLENKTLQSSAPLCRSKLSVQTTYKGIYSLKDNSIRLEYCELDVIPITFELRNDELILHLACIEGCSNKYKKLQ